MHDPARGPSLRQAGVEARTARPAPLTTAEAAELLRLGTAADVVGTLENIARLTASGRIDARTGNVLLLAATNGLRALDAAKEERREEEKRRAQEDARARAAEWAATPMGRLEKLADDALRGDTSKLMASLANLPS